MDQENMGWVPSMVKRTPRPPSLYFGGSFQVLRGSSVFFGENFQILEELQTFGRFFSRLFSKRFPDFGRFSEFLGNSQVILGDFKNFRVLRILQNFQIFRKISENLRGSSGFFLKKILTFFWIIMTPLTFETPMTTQVYDSTCYLWINSNTKPSQFLQFLSPDN